MIRVTVELDSAVTHRRTTLKVFEIVNDGSGTPTRGNYRVRYAGDRRVQARVDGHPRKAVSVLRLVAKAADALAEAWRLHLAERRATHPSREATED